MHRRTFIKAFALSASVVAMGVSFGVQAAETIKVGIMHSLRHDGHFRNAPERCRPDDHR